MRFLDLLKILGALLGLALFFYLIYSLYRPEKF